MSKYSVAKETYSEKEMLLIKHFELEDCIGFIYAPRMYQSMMERAFLNNDQSLAAESLRRCIRALSKGDIYRLTPEWDAMIEVSLTEDG